MLSILIPTYNQNVYPLVLQLLDQSRFITNTIEILVVDDFSNQKDTIAENRKIKKLQNCFYFSNSSNLGRTGTRQKLAEMAKYNWLLFLDADVSPKYEDFLKRYVESISQKKDVIFGGIGYQHEKPEIEKMLRWKYGKKREAKDVFERKKNPFFIISQNLLIKKNVFLTANATLENLYGIDNFFSNQLKNMNVTIDHIDNPVIHLGLENNTIFIKKSLSSIDTTFMLEKKGLMDKDIRPIQKSYIKLQKLLLRNTFSFFISKMKKIMERNFNSKNPNLFWFDLYRLNYYIKLKKTEND